MNELQVFDNPDFGSIRTCLIDDMPWAVGKDVALSLGYKNPNQAIHNHVDDEDKMGSSEGTPSVTDNLGRVQYPVWINESGLYALILSCTNKDDKVKRFKRWVTSEVLPSLRRTGTYTMPGKEASRVLTPDDYLTAARILSGCRNERMPYVVPLLRKAGIDLHLDLSQPGARRYKDPDTAALIDKAVKKRIVTMKKLEELTGISKTQLYRMRYGKSLYNPQRAALLRDIIQDLLPDVDLDELLDE